MEKEERRKIETFHRKPKRNLKPKIGKVLFGVSLLEQTPRLTTHKHVIAMNPQWPAQAQLAGPAQVKVYKTACSGKNYN
jgi:hypothetical protein